MLPVNLSESRILITNDDGFYSDGIKLLVNIAKKIYK
jgi:broad specificity polyphosphatase/5'/3'-nucleotidase SurE